MMNHNHNSFEFESTNNQQMTNNHNKKKNLFIYLISMLGLVIIFGAMFSVWADIDRSFAEKNKNVKIHTLDYSTNNLFVFWNWFNQADFNNCIEQNTINASAYCFDINSKIMEETYKGSNTLEVFNELYVGQKANRTYIGQIRNDQIFVLNKVVLSDIFKIFFSFVGGLFVGGISFGLLITLLF